MQYDSNASAASAKQSLEGYSMYEGGANKVSMCSEMQVVFVECLCVGWSYKEGIGCDCTFGHMQACCRFETACSSANIR